MGQVPLLQLAPVSYDNRLCVVLRASYPTKPHSSPAHEHHDTDTPNTAQMEGAIAYRVLPFAGILFEGTFLEGETKKWIHGTLMFVATACGIAGTVCIFKFHNATDGLTLYSLHSVLGLGTVILFTFQFLMGLFFFALQKNGAMRALSLIHI